MTDGEQAILTMVIQLNNTVLSIKKFLVDEAKKKALLTSIPQEEVKVRTQESIVP